VIAVGGFGGGDAIGVEDFGIRDGADSYHRADHKIGRVRSLRRDGEDVIASFWGRATRVRSAAATALLSVIGDVRVS
jgi:hypothetical protein